MTHCQIVLHASSIYLLVYHFSYMSIIGKSAKLGNAEARESKGYMNFPQASRKTMLGTRITCDPSNFKFTEPKNYEDASVLRHHNIMRPSEIDGRAFRYAFQAKTSRTKNDGKTHYGDGVPKVQDVGEDETNN
ncbi:hypothetical protein Lalb_Chr22g0349511 [Lupinus albus]|uniref:Uncharacterized protein n=1 Tax=Lupinus albus TaxID=3870 RepID=A0A6A4NKJ1_LUPAL|nr:hypothetical protein Lalb_Chr22g0349511 [Lupinus albus]